MLTIARWREMWKALGAANSDPKLHGELVACYSEPHRKYHTPQHLEECFEEFDEVRALAEHPAEIELALWFHDAIYNVNRHDNEKKSADWARASALAAGTPAEACNRVHALVMATRHKAVPRGTDAELLVDVDLSILGAAPERFDQYEKQVREEYAGYRFPVPAGTQGHPEGIPGAPADFQQRALPWSLRRAGTREYRALARTVKGLAARFSPGSLIPQNWACPFVWPGVIHSISFVSLEVSHAQIAPIGNRIGEGARPLLRRDRRNHQPRHPPERGGIHRPAATQAARAVGVGIG